jgi:hypothetical protein
MIIARKFQNIFIRISGVIPEPCIFTSTEWI